MPLDFSKGGRTKRRLGTDPLQHHLADRAPRTGAVSMRPRRPVPEPPCENGVGGRFTNDPVRDLYGHRPLGVAVTTVTPRAARRASGRRTASRDTRATPRFGNLVRAWGQACVHTPAPALPRGRSRSNDPWREGRVLAPLTLLRHSRPRRQERPRAGSLRRRWSGSRAGCCLCSCGGPERWARCSRSCTCTRAPQVQMLSTGPGSLAAVAQSTDRHFPRDVDDVPSLGGPCGPERPCSESARGPPPPPPL